MTVPVSLSCNYVAICNLSKAWSDGGKCSSLFELTLDEYKLIVFLFPECKVSIVCTIVIVVMGKFIKKAGRYARRANMLQIYIYRCHFHSGKSSIPSEGSSASL